MTFLRRVFLVSLLAAICTALLTGCGQSSPTPTRDVESPVSTPEDQTESVDSPQPTPTPRPSSTSVSSLPTPSSGDVATVGGVLIRDLADGNSEPGTDTKLQLARVIRSEEGTPLVASAGEKSSPTALTEEDGTFTFMDVPSDTYALVVVSPLGSFMIEDEEGEDFLIEVAAGEVLDLGTVHTDIPY